MKGIASKSVDLIICDLPFGCLTNSRKQDPDVKPSVGRKIVNLPCSWDIKIDLELFWKEIKRIRKDDHTPCLMFCTTRYGYELIKSNEKEFRYDLVWDKQRGVSFLSANRMPMRSHEMVYVFSKAGAKYNRIDIKGDFKAYIKTEGGTENKTYNSIRLDSKNDGGSRCALSVIKAANGTFKKNQHPTEKPLDLYKFLIERYSDAGDTVLDPTFGSCNSGLASLELKRKFIGVEKDNNFFWKAVQKVVV
jgi:site-specific DNA-methyltransferase (adenine-specific)